MSRSSTFVGTSSVAGLSPVSIAGRPLLLDHAAFRSELGRRAPELEQLLAEPLIARGADDELANISWYSSYDQTSHTLSELSERRREQVLQRLRALLVQALGLVDDPELGEGIRAMLVLPSADSVRALGTMPVLIDWAVAPAGLEASPEAYAAHFDAVFGPLCGVTLAQAPLTETPGATLGAAGAIAASDQAATVAAAEDGAEEAPVASAGETVAVVPESTVVPDTAVVPDGDSGVRQAPIASVGAGIVAFRPPWYAKPAVGVLLGVLLVALILWVLWWWLFAPGGVLSRKLDLSEPHVAILDGLVSERDRLRDLVQADCDAELVESAREGFSAPLILPEEAAVDGAGDEARPTLEPVADAGTQGAVAGSSLTALARSLERSVVLVFGLGRDGEAGMGTGFFISGDTLVTNRHVVEIVDPSKVFITSEFLGAVRPVRILTMTASSRIGHPDFALLRVDGAAPEGVLPLAIAPNIDKLARVVTAGFPAYISQSDPAFHALLGGNREVAPSMVFTSGEVSVVQQQPTGTAIIVHTADMSQGSSGGPLVDRCGRVAGVNTFIGTDDQSGRRGLYSLAGSGLMAFLRASGATFESANSACSEASDETAAGE